MKKIISFILLAVLFASLAVSCAEKNDDLLTYKYNYDLSEYITLADYKGIPASALKNDMSDKRIEEEILATRTYYSRLVEVTDRSAVTGDTVYVNYTLTVDGTLADSANNYQLKISGDTKIPAAVQTVLIGSKEGDVVADEYTYPENFEEKPEYAGKTGRYEFTVTAVCETELPELNDTFVKAYLGYNTVAEFEESIRAGFEKTYKKQFYNNIVPQVWSVISENTTVIKYPEAELKAMYDDMISVNKSYAEVQSLDFASYVRVVFNMSEDEFYEYAHKQTEERIKDEMIVYAIARAENVTLSDEEYKESATVYATEVYGVSSLELFEEMYNKKIIRQTVMFNKVKEMVADLADITYIN